MKDGEREVRDINTQRNKNKRQRKEKKRKKTGGRRDREESESCKLRRQGQRGFSYGPHFSGALG